MHVEYRPDYLTEPRLLPLMPPLMKWPVRYLRAARQEWRIAAANTRVMRRVRGGGPIRLELGSGPKPGRDGWTTVDLQPGCDLRLNLGRPLPFRDDEVTEIYSSHFLEYFAYEDILRLLKDWRRILQPAGRLRLSLPNARIFIQAYRPESNFDADTFCAFKPALHSRMRIDYVNYMAYMDAHRYMFDEENVVAVLRLAGFSRATLREFDPEVDLPQRRFESLYAEATK